MSGAIRFLVDEDFDNDILRGLVRRLPDLDIVRVQDVDLAGSKDPEVLEWAAQERRVLLTHDVSTMTAEAAERIRAGRPMPGLFAVPQSLPVGKAIEDIVLIAECSLEGEWEGQVRFLPLR
jgi:hypothetical protein